MYSNATDAISDLQMQGFTNDFHLSGNELLWVHENLFIRAGEFAILEYHKITDPGNNMNELVVFGISTPYHNIKGILLSRFRNYGIPPPMLVKKLNELKILPMLIRNK